MELLRSITLKVDLFAGVDIRNASCDLCELANRVGVLVEAEFNGVKLWARPDDNPLKLAEAFHLELISGKTHKIAQARDALSELV